MQNLKFSHLGLKTKTLLYETKSFCPLCGKILKSEIFTDGKSVYLGKECCGKTFEVLRENDLELFLKLKKYSPQENNINGIITLDVISNFINDISAVVIKLNSNCNLNCRICCIQGLDNYKLTFEELETFFDKIKNENKIIYLTGGEPTLSNHLFEIIKLVKKSGNIPFLITNGIKLADYEYTKKLKQSGLKIIHFSLDGLNDEINYRIRGSHGLIPIKILALKNIRKFGIKVFLSVTVIGGINDTEIKNIINFARFNNDFIKGVIIRPLVPQGRLDIKMNKLQTMSDLIKSIELQFDNITMDDFIEFKRFRFNAYKLIQKFFGKKYGKNMSFEPSLSCFFKVKGNSIEPLINYKELKKINYIIENSIKDSKFKTFINIIMNLPFNKSLLYFLLLGLSSKFNFSKSFEKSFFFKNILKIDFSELCTLINADFRERIVTYSLCKFNEKNILRVGYD
jgi:uncharacterized radical SAM superfamily Fe-S cluster-containing enzyme